MVAVREFFTLSLSFFMQSWETMPSETATFTSDITPLILAAHRDNYEIIKILLDRGCTLSLPHDARQVYIHITLH